MREAYDSDPVGCRVLGCVLVVAFWLCVPWACLSVRAKGSGWHLGERSPARGMPLAAGRLRELGASALEAAARQRAAAERFR